MRWVGHVARMGYKENANRVVLGNAEGKRSKSLGKTKRRLEGNIKVDLKRKKWYSTDSIYLAQNRDTVMKILIP
jgi:hypothetical protein